MTLLWQIGIATLAFFLSIYTASASILGHSGVVLHVDKYGHYTGHSTSYDYRFYPEKPILPLPLLHPHSILGHHPLESIHGYELLDHGYHGSEPLYYFLPHDSHHIYH